MTRPQIDSVLARVPLTVIKGDEVKWDGNRSKIRSGAGEIMQHELPSGGRYETAC
jgi:hypothetical protein